MKVSELGYGAMELRGLPRSRDISEDQAGEVLNAILDAGINFIDTSIDYGLSEERIGRHISDRRDEYYLASKCGCQVDWIPVDDRKYWPHDYGRDNVMAGVEQSLLRMRTDHLDLLQVHLAPSRAEMEESGVIDTMLELRSQGVVRHVGISTVLPNALEHVDMDVFEAFQIPYSIVQREHEPVIDALAARGAGIIVRGAVARGIPSGRSDLHGRHADLASKWETVAAGLDGLDPFEGMIRYVLSNPGVSTTIVGTVSPPHVARNVESADRGPLPPDLLA